MTPKDGRLLAMDGSQCFFPAVELGSATAFHERGRHVLVEKSGKGRKELQKTARRKRHSHIIADKQESVQMEEKEVNCKDKGSP